MGEFDKELKDMGSAWSDAPASSDLPEGSYTMTIQEAEIRKTKSSGKLRATFRYVVSEGEHQGASQFDGFTLDPENPVGMSMLKQLLGKKLGYEVPETIQEVQDILGDISKKNPIVTAQVVRKGDFTNVRVLEVVGEGGVAKPFPKKTPPTSAPRAVAASASLSEGDEVTFENEGKTEKGKIIKARADGSFDVEAESDTWREVPAEMLTLASGDDEASAEEEPATEEGDDRTSLLALAAAHGIAGLKDDMTHEKLVEELKGYEWKRDELTKDEIALLERTGILSAPKKTSPPPKKTEQAPKPAPKVAPKATPKKTPPRTKAPTKKGKR